MSTQISIDDQIKELARELAMRRNVYPKFIQSGKLKPETAQAQLARLEAAIESLKRLRDWPFPPPPKDNGNETSPPAGV